MKPVYHTLTLENPKNSLIYPHRKGQNTLYMLAIADFFLDILFPRLCLLCGKEGDVLCMECTKKLPPANTLSIPNTFALYAYADTRVKKILWHFKYHNGRSLAGVFAQRIYQKIAEECIFSESSHLEAKLPSENEETKREQILVVSIPITWASRWRRGFNQSTLVAQELTALNGKFQFSPNALTRIRGGKRQTAQKSRADRIHNMENVFAGDTSLFGRDVIVIDDVTTTGATLREARRALLTAGAKVIYSFVIAH